MTHCPACDRPTAPAFKPFCSRGCKDRDLLRWLNESYRIPAQDSDPDDGTLDKLGDPD